MPLGVRTATDPGAGGGSVVVVVVDVVLVEVLVVDVVLDVEEVAVGASPDGREVRAASSSAEPSAQAVATSASAARARRVRRGRRGTTTVWRAHRGDRGHPRRRGRRSVGAVTDRAARHAELPPHRHERWMRYGQGPTTYFAAHVGLVVEDVRVDYCRMRLPWRTEIAQPFGVAHGGALAALVDCVLVPAIGAGYDEPVGFATIDLTVQYLQALRDEDAVAEGWINQRGSSVAFCEAEVRGASSGALVAKGVMTYKISRPKRPDEVRL